jgi:serine/threonine-protein kinase
MSAPLLPTGAILAGRFTVQATLAHRPWAATYGAIAAPNRELVLKVIDPSLGVEAGEAIRSAQAAVSALGDRGVVPLVESGQIPENGAQFLVTARCAQPSLAQLVELCPLTVEETVVFARNMARVLDVAHATGVVHGALKPSNVFVGPAPELAVRLADFGAEVLRRGADEAELAAFAGPWLAPEQWGQGRARASADLFTFGLLTFFALTGRRFLRADARDPSALRVSASERAQEIGASISSAADPVFTRALAPDPRDRFPTARAFVDALAVACGQLVPAHSAPPAPVPASRAPVVGEQVTSAPAVAISIGPTPKATTPPVTAPMGVPLVAAAKPAPSSPPAIAEVVAEATPLVPPPKKSRRFPLGAAAGGGLVALAALVALVARFAPIHARTPPPKATEAPSVVAAAPPTATAPNEAPPPSSPPAVASITAPAPIGGDSPAPAAPTPAASESAAPAPVVADSPAPAAPAPVAADTPAPAAPEAVETTLTAAAADSNAQLVVTCEPACERVLVNGKPMASYPDPASLPPGSYGIGVGRHGYGGQYRMIKLSKGEHTTVHFTLNAVRRKCGKFLERCD